MPDEEIRCKHCNQVIVVITGHRPRQYCNDAHRQAAHRERLEKARRVEAEKARQAAIQRERAQLISQYGNLLPQTLDFLQSFESSALAHRIATVIATEKKRTREDLAGERSMVIGELLLAGEQIDFPALCCETFDLEAGLPDWLAFCNDSGTSLERLYLARDATYLKIQAANGRKRLAQLV